MIHLQRKNHIQFVAKLGVTYNRIPVNDYDLCVILGNMLDNCLKACIANPSSENFIHIAIATTENDKFTIHCENTTAEGTSLEHIHASRQNSLYHGYGLTNIRNTAEKYHGFFTYSVETLFYMDLMIPIIEKMQTHYALIQLIECLRIGRQEFLHEVLYFRVAL